MDSNASGFLSNPSSLGSVYYNAKEEDGIIDLGLSLRTLQPEAYHPPGHSLEWPRSHVPEDGDDEGIQSKERWAYVKVNMDGVMVGRKICILDHQGYQSLARKLEYMFGRQSESGLRLFQSGSEYSLFYKDREENWRPVGDVPWGEFIENVKRLRIARN